MTKDQSEYKQVNGTFYQQGTPDKITKILENSRHSQQRIVVFYGDGKTGRPWGDIVEGHIGRSTGPIKIPLMIYNSRSLGGSAVLDNCIVKILAAKGKRVLYQHPDYETLKTDVEFYGKNARFA